VITSNPEIEVTHQCVSFLSVWIGNILDNFAWDFIANDFYNVMCYTLPRYDLRLHVEHKYPIIQIHTHYNVLVNQVSVSQVSDFILLEFNPFGDTTFDIIMLLLCLWYLMRLSANFQVTF